MTDTTTGSTTTPTDTGKPPVFEGAFDAERAARLVANLRADLDKVRGELTTTKQALDAREDAEKSDLQKAQDRIKALESDLVKVTTESLRSRIAAKHNLPEDLIGFLTGDTEAEIEAKAEALAKFAPKKETEETQEVIPGKPTTRLVPGHSTGDVAPAPDLRAMADAIRDGV